MQINIKNNFELLKIELLIKFGLMGISFVTIASNFLLLSFVCFLLLAFFLLFTSLCVLFSIFNM